MRPFHYRAFSGIYMAISLIAALDENFAIGRKGQLPWHLPDDLRWFKQLTTGKNVLMGYNTAVSIGRARRYRTTSAPMITPADVSENATVAWVMPTDRFGSNGDGTITAVGADG